MQTKKEDELVLFKELFYRKLEECSGFLFYPRLSNIIKDGSEENKKITLPSDVNYRVKYKINKHGYRGKDFLKNKEILTLGCSQTFGMGIPERFIWPQVFSDKINIEFDNLATPGDSLQGQVYKAFQYFKEFGHPKFILGFFPYARMELPYIPNIFGKINNDGSSDDGKQDPIIQKVILEPNKKVEKYSKIPHNPESVLPGEVATFYSFMFIQILEQYCKTNNIELIWTFYSHYDGIEEYLQKELPELLNNYISIKNAFMYAPICHSISEKIDDPNIDKCHRELENHPLFNHAADCDHLKNQNGHFSIHFNQHVANLFYEEYLKRINK